jgi:hypothetical protein
VRITSGKQAGHVGVVKRSGHGFYRVVLRNGDEVMKRAHALLAVEPDAVSIDMPESVTPSPSMQQRRQRSRSRSPATTASAAVGSTTPSNSENRRRSPAKLHSKAASRSSKVKKATARKLGKAKAAAAATAARAAAVADAPVAPRVLLQSSATSAFSKPAVTAARASTPVVPAAAATVPKKVTGKKRKSPSATSAASNRYTKAQLASESKFNAPIRSAMGSTISSRMSAKKSSSHSTAAKQRPCKRRKALFNDERLHDAAEILMDMVSECSSSNNSNGGALEPNTLYMSDDDSDQEEYYRRLHVNGRAEDANVKFEFVPWNTSIATIRTFPGTFQMQSCYGYDFL